MKTIVCFGDSVTQGVPHVHIQDTFVKLLERRLTQRPPQEERVVCINSGVGGENTAEALARFEPAVARHEPDLVIIEFGLNDIRYEPEKTIAPDAFAENLRIIHREVTALGARAIFTTPNVIINAYHEYSKGTDYYDRWGGCNGAIIEYAGIVREVTAELGAPLCDVCRAFADKALELEFAGGWPDYTDFRCLGTFINISDGVHPTALGHALIAFELYKLIVLEGLLD